MEKFSYFCRAAVAALVLLPFFSCHVEEQEHAVGTRMVRDTERRAIIDDARRFFEKQVVRTRTGPAPLFDLGNIVPDWDGAVISEKDIYRAVDVSFRSEHCLKVTRSKVLGDTTDLYNVSAWQKLVMLENRRTGSRTYAYVTLVPSRGYYRRHKHMDVNRFVHYGEKDDFTGHAIYTDAANQTIFRVNFYIDGEKKCGATTLGDREHRAARIDKMRQMLVGMYIKKRTNIVTRSGDEWDVDGGTIDDVVVTPPDDWNNPDEEDMDDWSDNDPNEDDWDFGWDPDWYYHDDSNTRDDGTDQQDNETDDPAEPKELPNSPEIVVRLLGELLGSEAAAKLLAVVSLDKIHVMDHGREGYGGVTNSKTSEIYLYDQQPYILLEELMHRYQLANPNIHGSYKGNMEIEAKLLVYDYLHEIYNTESGLAANMGPVWRDFGDFAEHPSEATWARLPSILYRMGYEYPRFKTSEYDDFRTDNYDRVKNK